MIELKNISKSFNNKQILNNINLEVEEGETVAIVGFSGSGKSTVLKIISGLINADSGELNLEDNNIAMVFQYSALFDSLNIADNIAFALNERKDLKNKYTHKQIKRLVEEKLQLVGLSGIENMYPNELSGGMQKRVSFARAIITNPKIILYDEPTAGLDPVSSTVIEDYIVMLQKETKAASIVVTHQMSTIQRTATKVIMLYDGDIVWSGTPSEMLSSQDEYAKQFVQAKRNGPMTTTAG